MRKLTTEQFIMRAREIHDDLYDYSLVKYINDNTKVSIKCHIHDIFTQEPGNHLRGRKGGGQGCPKCYEKISDIIYLKQNLTIEEEPIEVDGKIQCRCAYCKEYFIPTKRQLHARMNAISGKVGSENKLYCSNKCKYLCPVYYRQKYYKDLSKNKINTSRPDQSELRRLVLERDNNQCQRCGSTTNLHCHHFTGVEINPIESADIDNCITLCDKCHQKSHNEKGCSMKRESCVIKDNI